MVLFQQMMIFAMIMAIGIYLAKRDILDEITSKKLSWIVANVANPAMILSGSTSREQVNSQQILFVLAFAFAFFLILILVSKLVVHLFFRRKDECGIYNVLMVFSNMGFMGLPLAAELYGSEAIIYISMFLIPFNVLIYTYGITCLAGNANDTIESRLKKILNPGLLAGIITLFVCVTNITIPTIFSKLLDMVGSITGPLCMILIGASFIGIRFTDILKDKRLMLFSLIKLILLPLMGMLLLLQFIENETLLRVCFIVLATPAGSLSVILSKQYGLDDTIAAKSVAFTTLCSVITMPLLLKIINI